MFISVSIFLFACVSIFYILICSLLYIKLFSNVDSFVRMFSFYLFVLYNQMFAMSNLLISSILLFCSLCLIFMFVDNNHLFMLFICSQEFAGHNKIVEILRSEQVKG